MVQYSRAEVALCQPIDQVQAGDAVEVMGVVSGQRQGVNQRDASDLQIEIGEGRAGPPEGVFQFAMTAGGVCVKWQDRHTIQQHVHLSEIVSDARGLVCAER